MVGEPVCPPRSCNILPLIWTYLIKSDGTKKPRYVCNSSTSRRGSVTMAHTYAAALHNYTAFGSDATNAFDKALPPNAPIYILPLIGNINHGGRMYLNARQLQLATSYLFDMLFRDILSHDNYGPKLSGDSLNFKCTTHALCLYTGTLDGTPIFYLCRLTCCSP